MRAADVAECAAWDGSDPEAALRRSCAASPLCWTALLDGAPMCLCGLAVAHLCAAEAAPWALGTDDVEREPLAFLRRSAALRDVMLRHWRRLVNWTDARHVRSHAWLRWLGFALDDPEPAGVAGLPFHKFWLEAG